MVFKLRNCLYLLLFVFCIGWGRTCPGEIGIAAEWLYVLPSIDHPYFAAIDVGQEGDTLVRNRIPLDRHWHSGYRLEGFYSSCDSLTNILIRWTHFPSFSDSQSIDTEFEGITPLFIPLLLFSGNSTRIKTTYNFHYADALLGWRAIDCCPFFLTLQGGIQYCYLRFKEEAVNAGTEGVIFSILYNLKSTIRGVGPEIGADFNYCFCNCFNLVARSYGSLLINKRQATSLNTVESTDPAGESIKNTSLNYWQLVPFFNMRFGLGVSPSVGIGGWQCSNIDIEVGYEGSWLFNSINQIGAVQSGGLDFGFLYDDLMTFALHGPYVHIGIVF